MAPQGYVRQIEWVDSNDAHSRKRALAHADQESRRKRQWMKSQQLLKSRQSTLEAFGLSEGSPRSPRSPRSQHSPHSSRSSPGSPVAPTPDPMLLDPEQTPRIPQALRDEVFEHIQEVVEHIRGDELPYYSTTNAYAHNLSRHSSIHTGFSMDNDDEEQSVISPEAGIREQMYPDPLSWLSSLRRDSSQCVPLDLDHDGQRLVDHYMAVLPSLLFNVQQFMPFREFTWSLASAGPLAVRALVMTFSATHLARLRGVKEDVQSIQQKQTVIKMLQERIEGPNAHLQQDDETISAILAVASTENQFGSPVTSLLHMRAGMQLIRRRGGPRAFDQNRKLAAYANWIDFTLPRPHGFQDLCTLSSQVSQTAVNTNPNLADPASMYADLGEFSRFLANAQVLSHHHAWSNGLEMSRRHTMFQPGTLLHQMLLSPVDFGGRDSKRVTVNARLATLVYIHVMLWDYRHSPELCERFLENLRLGIEEQELPRNQSIVLLVWILLKMDHDDVMPPVDAKEGSVMERRPWFVASIVRVAKLLTKQSWAKVNGALLGFLDMSHGGDEAFLESEYGSDWRDGMEKEVLEERAF